MSTVSCLVLIRIKTYDWYKQTHHANTLPLTFVQLSMRINMNIILVIHQSKYVRFAQVPNTRERVANGKEIQELLKTAPVPWCFLFWRDSDYVFIVCNRAKQLHCILLDLQLKFSSNPKIHLFLVVHTNRIHHKLGHHKTHRRVLSP